MSRDYASRKIVPPVARCKKSKTENEEHGEAIIVASFYLNSDIMQTQ